MQTADNESFILDMFDNVDQSDIAMFGNLFKCISLLNSIKCKSGKKNWIDSSKKNDNPPDFFNDKKKLMMEVMRIDDHAFLDKNGKVQNPTLQKENAVLKKYFGKNYKTERPDLKITVVADTGLSTKDDHSFDKYYNNFIRVINKHKNSISLYRKNHPNYKLVFFIFDESTAYYEVMFKESLTEQDYIGKQCLARPHYFCCDKKFVEVIKQLDIDYLVWYAPYKLLQVENGFLDLPKAAIYDVENINDKNLIEYRHDYMKSSEL